MFSSGNLIGFKKILGVHDKTRMDSRREERRIER
jgi:hypothetical protein